MGCERENLLILLNYLNVFYRMEPQRIYLSPLVEQIISLINLLVLETDQLQVRLLPSARHPIVLHEAKLPRVFQHHCFPISAFRANDQYSIALLRLTLIEVPE